MDGEQQVVGSIWFHKKLGKWAVRFDVHVGVFPSPEMAYEVLADVGAMATEFVEQVRAKYPPYTRWEEGDLEEDENCPGS